jgi:MFS family permease
MHQEHIMTRGYSGINPALLTSSWSGCCSSSIATAAEVFPTDIRSTFQGFSAAMGKVGAIIADVVFGYVNQQTTFFMSAAFGLAGACVTWLFLPDTTGLSLDELDRMAKYMLAGEFEHYHGEGVNPRHLSTWER